MGLGIRERVENFILGFLVRERLANLLWWSEILFRGCANVKIDLIPISM